MIVDLDSRTLVLVYFTRTCPCVLGRSPRRFPTGTTRYQVEERLLVPPEIEQLFVASMKSFRSAHVKPRYDGVNSIGEGLTESEMVVPMFMFLPGPFALC